MILGLSERDERAQLREFFAEVERTDPGELPRLLRFFGTQLERACPQQDFSDREPDGRLRSPAMSVGASA